MRSELNVRHNHKLCNSNNLLRIQYNQNWVEAAKCEHLMSSDLGNEWVYERESQLYSSIMLPATVAPLGGLNPKANLL